MSLSISSTNLSEQLVKLPQKKITQVIIVLLLIYIAYLLAKMTWFAIPQSQNFVQAKASNVGHVEQARSNTISVKKIQALSIFGKFNEQVEDIQEEVVIENAPETRLKLTLTGVVASNDKSIASAIIENGGKQNTYSLGDTIKGTRAVLENVFNDRVIIKVSGRLETLMFEGMKFEKKVRQINGTKSSLKKAKNTQTTASNRVDQRNNKSLTAVTKSLKQTLDKEPGKITDYLKITPKRVNREIVGYQLMPGKDPTFFKSSGLKAGDVAIQMNGFDLTNVREAAQAMKSLKEEKEISLLLNRNDDVTEILFNIDN